MFIKFDDFEMIDFFEKEPIAIGEAGAGTSIYSTGDDKFQLVFVVDVYLRKIDISITFDKHLVFKGQFEKVIEIRKSENDLQILLESTERVTIKRYPCVGIIME